MLFRSITLQGIEEYRLQPAPSMGETRPNQKLFFLTFPKVAKKRGMLLKIGAVWQLMIIGAGVVKPCRGGDKKFDVRKCR